MSKTTQEKHAEYFNEWNAAETSTERAEINNNWLDEDGDKFSLYFEENGMELRTLYPLSIGEKISRKPKTWVIRGKEVPMPRFDQPKDCSIYFLRAPSDKGYDEYYVGSDEDQNALRLALRTNGWFDTKEAVIANVKAMRGEE